MRSEVEFNVSRQFLGMVMSVDKYHLSLIIISGKKVECLSPKGSLSDPQEESLSFLSGDVQIDVNLGPSNTSLHVDPEILVEVFKPSRY